MSIVFGRLRRAVIFAALPVLAGGAAPAAPEREAFPAVVAPAVASPLRRPILLDGMWDFAVDPGNVGETERWFAPGTSLPSRTAIRVPGCWEAQGVGGPGRNAPAARESSPRSIAGCYTGAAWYRREVPLPPAWEGRRIWLKIGGVNAQGWFWVNGTFVGHLETYCGAHRFDVTDLVRPGQSATIAVRVRNDVPSSKGLMNWIQRFGGLYRSVELEATTDPWIDDVWVEPLFEAGAARVHVRLRAAAGNAGGGAFSIEVTTATPEGATAGRAVREAGVGGGEAVDVALDVALRPFRPWSPESPVLYTADVVLRREGRDLDGWRERFGVRQLEARGADLFLNGRRYFLRGYGDDFIYPLTLCSPASREAHRKNLLLAKSYGFNYVRLHTHCEVPEFFEAADEVGMMVQPELPYYGTRPSSRLPELFQPERHLRELIAHRRRHVSLAAYCMGNEGHLGAPLDETLYRLAKEADPRRLAIHQDGGTNTPANSDIGAGVDILHEHLNLALLEDPRLEGRYTGALRAPRSLAAARAEAETAGLSWSRAAAGYDAGYELQRHYQKAGLEEARLDPARDGYIFWTIVDVGSTSAQGLLDSFWEPKRSAPEWFRRFNGPTAVLARMKPLHPVLREGESLDVEWVVSHFGEAPITGGTLAWRMVAEGRAMASGELETAAIAPGTVPTVGTTTIRVPPVGKPLAATLEVSLAGAGVENAWDVWIFPRAAVPAGGGGEACATPPVFEKLKARCPGLARLDGAGAAERTVILADALTPDVREALARGRRVILLSLAGFGPVKPGVALGWWTPGLQTGTAVPAHPAWGDFPHAGWLSPLYFRMVDEAAPAGGRLKGVEPLMVGHGSKGYLLYAFQARAGAGRLLATGLNLLSDHPEAAWLLDRFVAYARSEAFQPAGTIDVQDVPSSR